MSNINNNINFIVLFFTIIGTLCWGIAPIFVKVGLANVNPLVALFIRTSFTLGLVISWLIFSGRLYHFRKISMTSVILLIAEATLATFLGDLAYFTAVKYGSVSFVTAFMSSSPIITMILSMIILGEPITPIRIIGALLILIGVFLIL